MLKFLKIFSCFFLATLSLPVFSQTHLCGFDKFRNTQVAVTELTEEKINNILYSKALESFTLAKQQMPVLTIPVVVHVVHQNGPENIPDSVITAAIYELNLRFANSSPYYDSTGHDTQIQFCLASVDPDGNPATGITRTVSPYTDLFGSVNATEFNLKNLIRWDTHLYLNIWIVHDMVGTAIAGFANYPNYAGTWTDGIVVRYNYFTGPILAHEAGHYLGLYHTFQGGCTNFNCMLDGDNVCDTPPDVSDNQNCMDNSCNTDVNDTTGFSPFITDVDNLPNYMDYTSCPLSFSQGQADRMYDALSTIRTTLLQSNGCGSNPGGAIPVASFDYDSIGCPKNAFINTSLNGVGAAWDFNNDGLIDHAGNYVDYQFPGTGTYTVTMYAYGYGGSDSVTQQVYVQSPPTSNYPVKNVYGLTTSTILGLAYCSGDTITCEGEPGMVSYQWSTGDTTQVFSFVPNGQISITLTAVDSAGLIWNSCSPFVAEEAPSTIPSTVSIQQPGSGFCLGDPLIIEATYSPLLLFSNWYANQIILSSYSFPTYQTTTQLFNTFFIIQIDSNGCSSYSNTISFMGDYHALTGNLMQSGDTLVYANTFNFHHEWYLDGVAIPNSDTTRILALQPGCYSVMGWYQHQECGTLCPDSVCITVSGTHEYYSSDDIRVYPNPASEFVYVDPMNNYIKELSIRDLTGRELLNKQMHDPANDITEINMAEFPAGIYTILVKNDKGFSRIKLLTKR